MRAELEGEARKLGIAHAVVFAGFLSQLELRELFYRSHFFLHPSEIASDGNQEGVPNSLLEAMASGLPVFATRHGGIPEVVEDGATGFLVTERDEEALAGKLLVAAGSSHSVGEIAARASKFVAENFELHAQARKLEEIYFEAMASKNFAS